MTARGPILALALLATACGPGADVTLRPAPELREATVRAIALWQPVLARCGREFTLTEDHPDATIEFGDTRGYYGLTTTPFDGTIRVRISPQSAETWPELLDHAVSHELGHVLGSPESDRIADLMYPSPSGGTVPTPHDAELVGCRP